MKRTVTHTLRGSGMTVTLAMPNLYQLIASSIKVPNPMTARIIELLEGSGLLSTATPAQQAAYARDTLMGAMELAALCLTQPRLVLDRDPGEGEVGPEAFAHSDWGELLALFRANPARPAADQGSGGAATPVADEPGDRV
jgi:hypothetical protein